MKKQVITGRQIEAVRKNNVKEYRYATKAGKGLCSDDENRPGPVGIPHVQSFRRRGGLSLPSPAGLGHRAFGPS
jgi:hypothetical protein